MLTHGAHCRTGLVALHPPLVAQRGPKVVHSPARSANSARPRSIPFGEQVPTSGNPVVVGGDPAADLTVVRHDGHRHQLIHPSGTYPSIRRMGPTGPTCTAVNWCCGPGTLVVMVDTAGCGCVLRVSAPAAYSTGAGTRRFRAGESSPRPSAVFGLLHLLVDDAESLYGISHADRHVSEHDRNLVANPSAAPDVPPRSRPGPWCARRRPPCEAGPVRTQQELSAIPVGDGGKGSRRSPCHPSRDLIRFTAARSPSAHAQRRCGPG